MNTTAIALKIAALPLRERLQSQALWRAAEKDSIQDYVQQLQAQFIGWTDDFTDQLSILDDCEKLGISHVSFLDRNYPLNTEALVDYPPVLYFRGKLLACRDQNCSLAIVGSRNADRFGFDITRQLAKNLGEVAVIVSGLALGIDQAAHQGALESEKKSNTIAVLAHGLDQIYPRSNTKLAHRIIEQEGCLVSQFAPGVTPKPHHFLVRNAVIAGLAQAVLVVQAGERSGALATARHALEHNKDVLALPGRVDDPRFAGTNRLIQQGAHLVQNLQDICNILNLDWTPTQTRSELVESKSQPRSNLAKRILNTIKTIGAVNYLDLIEQLQPAERLHEEILQLELDGIIQRQPGNYLAIKK